MTCQNQPQTEQTEIREEQEFAAFSRPQTYGQFLTYLLPSMITMIFLSFYNTIDGFFVSRFVGKDALAAINIIIPLTCVFFGLSVMIATGGGAIISVKLGEGKSKEANGFFSFLFWVVVAIAVFLTIIGICFLKPILLALGSTPTLLPYTTPYGLVTILSTLPMMLKLFLEYFARADGASQVALTMATAGLITNIVLDGFFIIYCHLGILGAALGTMLAMTLSAAIGLVYFLRGNSRIRIGKPRPNWWLFGHCCYNGSSEMFTEFSTGITTLLFNIAILEVYGEPGVSAMSIITYAYYFFIAVYFGISVGTAPMISYNYGAQNINKMQESLKYSMITLVWSSLVIFSVAHFGSSFLVDLFSKETEVVTIAVPALKLFSFCFLCIGFNVFASGLFTAVCNGKISAVISIFRSLIFVAAGILIWPRTALGVNGIWLTVPFAEVFTLLISLFYCYRYRRVFYPHKKDA